MEKEKWRMTGHEPEKDISERQMIGNKSIEANYILKCMHCGADKGLTFVAHRNKEECITGFIVVCQECLKIIGDTEKKIRMVISSK
jgi:hypothetical protein